MKNFLSIFAFIMIIACVTTSCKEPVEGCTDSEAENYNPEAEVNSNNCVYSRDKFLNEYNGINECPSPLPEESTFVLEISEGLSGNNAVQIEFKDLDLPVPILEGTAKGDSIIVEPDVYQVPLGLDPNDPDKLYDVTMSAVAIYISSDSIVGELNLVALSIPATCDFRAGKK